MGAVSKYPRAPMGFIKKFIDEAVAFDGEGCFEYPYGNPKYRPRVLLDGKQDLMSRVVLTRTAGPAPKGKPHALHDPVRCNNFRCCSPAHLRWGSHQENMADRFDAGTAKYRPTPEIVSRIRDLYRRHYRAEDISEKVGWPVSAVTNTTLKFNFSTHTDITYLAARNATVRNRLDAWPDVDTIDSLIADIQADRRALMLRVSTKRWTRDHKILVMRRLNFTLQAIGDLYGITRERVRQIEERGRYNPQTCIDCKKSLGQVPRQTKRCPECNGVFYSDYHKRKKLKNAKVRTFSLNGKGRKPKLEVFMHHNADAFYSAMNGGAA